MSGDLPFEESMALSSVSTVPEKTRETLVKMRNENEILADAITLTLRLQNAFGDHDAFIADTCNDIVGDLRLLQLEMEKRPEAMILKHLSSLDDAEASQLRERILKVVGVDKDNRSMAQVAAQERERPEGTATILIVGMGFENNNWSYKQDSIMRVLHQLWLKHGNVIPIFWSVRTHNDVLPWDDMHEFGFSYNQPAEYVSAGTQKVVDDIASSGYAFGKRADSHLGFDTAEEGLRTLSKRADYILLLSGNHPSSLRRDVDAKTAPNSFLANYLKDRGVTDRVIWINNQGDAVWAPLQ